MVDIRHRVGITAPTGRVYQALATRDGLSGWWTRDVRGTSEAGGKLEFFFGGSEPAAVMEVIDLVPGRRVAWRCVEGPDEWVGTSLTFDLAPGGGDGETVLRFSHADWREPTELMSHCSTKWAYFMLGLRAGLEGGGGGGLAMPYPDDMKISSWG